MPEERQKGHILGAERDWNPLVRAVNACAVPGEGGGGAMAPLTGREEVQDFEQIPGRVMESFLGVILSAPRPTQYSLTRMVNPIHLPRRTATVDGVTTTIPIPSGELPIFTDYHYWVQQVDVIGSLGLGGFVPGYAASGIIFRKRWVEGRIVSAINLAELTLDFKHLITRPRIYPNTTYIYNDRSPDQPNWVSSSSIAECSTTFTAGQLVMVHKITDVRSTFRGEIGGGPTVTEVNTNGDHFVFTLGLPQIRHFVINPFRPPEGWGFEAEAGEGESAEVTFGDISAAFPQDVSIIFGYYGPADGIAGQQPEGFEEWIEGGPNGVPPPGDINNPGAPVFNEYIQNLRVLPGPCGSNPGVPEGATDGDGDEFNPGDDTESGGGPPPGDPVETG